MRVARVFLLCLSQRHLHLAAESEPDDDAVFAEYPHTLHCLPDGRLAPVEGAVSDAVHYGEEFIQPRLLRDRVGGGGFDLRQPVFQAVTLGVQPLKFAVVAALRVIGLFLVQHVDFAVKRGDLRPKGVRVISDSVPRQRDADVLFQRVEDVEDAFRLFGQGFEDGILQDASSIASLSISSPYSPKSVTAACISAITAVEVCGIGDISSK
jgi:hypothetical protein